MGETKHVEMLVLKFAQPLQCSKARKMLCSKASKAAHCADRPVTVHHLQLRRTRRNARRSDETNA